MIAQSHPYGGAGIVMESSVLDHAPAPDRLAPVSDREQVTVIVAAVVRLAEAWQLPAAQGAALFDVPATTWSRMRGGQFQGSLDQDKVTRASLLLGIFAALGQLFDGPLTDGWPTRPNTGPLFAGRSPVEAMIAGGIPAMAGVRRHLDALRAGA